MLMAEDIEQAINILESDVPPKRIASSLWLLIEELRDLADDIYEEPEPEARTDPAEQWRIERMELEAAGQRNMFKE